MEIRVSCPCAQTYAFDVEPVNGAMPVAVNCPACGADGTSLANDIIRQTLGISAPGTHSRFSGTDARLPGCACGPTTPASSRAVARSGRSCQVCRRSGRAIHGVGIIPQSRPRCARRAPGRRHRIRRPVRLVRRHRFQISAFWHVHRRFKRTRRPDFLSGNRFDPGRHFRCHQPRRRYRNPFISCSVIFSLLISSPSS